MGGRETEPHPGARDFSGREADSDGGDAAFTQLPEDGAVVETQTRVIDVVIDIIIITLVIAITTDSTTHKYKVTPCRSTIK